MTSSREPGWKKAGWLPVYVEAVERNESWWMVRGRILTQTDGRLLRFLTTVDLSLTIGSVIYCRPRLDERTYDVSYLLDESGDGVEPKELLGFQLDPYDALPASMVVAAFSGNPASAFEVAWALSYAIRDEEAARPVSTPRFPGRVHWGLVKRFFQEALDAGELIAAHNLGHMALRGYGQRPNPIGAIELLERAEALGLPETFDLLVECYEAGAGVWTDFERAAEYRAKASAARSAKEAD